MPSFTNNNQERCPFCGSNKIIKNYNDLTSFLLTDRENAPKHSKAQSIHNRKCLSCNHTWFDPKLY